MKIVFILCLCILILLSSCTIPLASRSIYPDDQEPTGYDYTAWTIENFLIGFGIGMLFYLTSMPRE